MAAMLAELEARMARYWRPMDEALLKWRPENLVRACEAAVDALEALPDDEAAAAVALHENALRVAARLPHTGLVLLLARLGATGGLAEALQRALPRAESAEEVAALLAAGADARSVHELRLAVELGRLDVLEALLAAGAPATGDAVYEAAKALDLPATRLLLAHGGGTAHRGQWGKTPLMAAARAAAVSYDDRVGVLEALLDAGAELDATDDHGGTALGDAALGFNPAAFWHLLRGGAAPGGAPRGTPPLCLVAWGACQKPVKCKVVPGRVFPPRGAAMARALIEAGASADARNRRGLNAVAVGISPGNWCGLAPDVADVLLEHGADPCCALSTGEPAVFFAQRRGSVEVVLRLRRAGLPADTRDARGRTLLHVVPFEGRDVSPVLDEVLGSGVNVDTPDGEGETPLHESVRQKAEAARCEYFLKAGADPYRANDNGETAFALGKGHANDEVRAVFERYAEAERRAVKAATAALLPSVLVEMAASYAAEKDGVAAADADRHELG